VEEQRKEKRRTGKGGILKNQERKNVRVQEKGKYGKAGKRGIWKNSVSGNMGYEGKREVDNMEEIGKAGLWQKQINGEYGRDSERWNMKEPIKR
jgi:hypothetical protein